NLPAGPNPNSIALGEFNRNGKLDIAVADFNNAGVGSLGVIHNNGTGSFQPFVSFPAATGHANFVSVGDLDGDGIPDVVTSLDNGQIEVFLASGPGVLYNLPSGAPLSSVIADFNGDGNPDVLVPSDRRQDPLI